MEEADRVFRDYMNGPYIEEKEVDHAVYAKRAHDRGLAKYDELFAMQTLLMNLFAAGLFHLFEQQMAYMIRHDGEAVGNEVGASFATWANTLMGIDVTVSPQWSTLQELKLVANVAKHAEGRSENALRLLRIDLFGHPLLREPTYRDIPPGEMPTRTPLAGTDLYVTKGDFEQYVNVVNDFWLWFMDEVLK